MPTTDVHTPAEPNACVEHLTTILGQTCILYVTQTCPRLLWHKFSQSFSTYYEGIYCMRSVLSQLYLTSLGAKTRQRLDDIGDYSGWDVSSSVSPKVTVKFSAHKHKYVV